MKEISQLTLISPYVEPCVIATNEWINVQLRMNFSFSFLNETLMSLESKTHNNKDSKQTHDRDWSKIGILSFDQLFMLGCTFTWEVVLGIKRHKII